MTILNTLKRAKWRGGSYEARQGRWQELHDEAATLCAQLPFRWHAVAMDNPTQNHTGTTNGADHIVLDEAYDPGRLHRTAGQAL